MNKTLKQLSEEYYELLNLGEIMEDQYSLADWILEQCPNKDIKIISHLWNGTFDILNLVLDNMTDIDISNCNQTIGEIIKENITDDDELSLDIKDIIFE